MNANKRRSTGSRVGRTKSVAKDSATGTCNPCPCPLCTSSDGIQMSRFWHAHLFESCPLVRSVSVYRPASTCPLVRSVSVYRPVCSRCEHENTVCCLPVPRVPLHIVSRLFRSAQSWRLLAFEVKLRPDRALVCFYASVRP
jgi:hypothetical protein